MPALKERLTDRVEEVRQRRPLVDHVVRMVQHYGEVKGNLQAGAVTYFAFLSFFPILALAFAVVGYVARIYPQAQADLLAALDEVLPGIIGNGEGQVPLSSIEEAAPGILSIGLPVVLYSGLRWLSAMRDALQVVFGTPPKDKPNLFVGKARDLLALATLGAVLMLSIAVSGVITSLVEPILDLLQLGVGATPLLWVLALALGLAASSVLFFAFFRVLAGPSEPTRSLWAGALLGAIGFELLKQLSRFLLTSTAEQPAFQAFGIALILVVWINYFSRVVMYAAAWAYTSPEARELRERAQWTEARDATLPEGPGTGPAVVVAPADAVRRPHEAPAAPGRGKPFAAGAVAGAVVGVAVALVRRAGGPGGRR